ncbi:MAG: hypothetical protein HQ572_04280 [Candidatus Omnitrophica bacterium]|nr:hypothetical protein [Candidatus Omnitrophota bacterium]
MVKLGLAISSLIAGLLINLSGFDIALGANQTVKALLYMRLFDIGIPIVTSLAAVFIIMSLGLTEAKAYEIRAQIERRREERRTIDRREEERRREDRRKPE